MSIILKGEGAKAKIQTAKLRTKVKKLWVFLKFE